MACIRKLLVCISCAILLAGCAPQSQSSEAKRGDKTREAVARATERMKPELEWTAQKLRDAAEWAADETVAAIEGFIEGWFREPTHPVNLNSASLRRLENLPGISADEAQRIAGARPYHDKRELVRRGVMSESAYARIKDRIAVD